MSAAERNFIRPPANEPQWIELAQNVFDRQSARWDNSTCGGGLRWQWIPINAGYNYKSAATNAFFFQLAARLARYTGNQTYSSWASTTFDWSQATGLIDESYNVWDGFSIDQNCSTPNHLQWTYSPAAYMYGSAVMYNITNGDRIWQSRTEGLLNQFFAKFAPLSTGGVLVETACESQANCNTDQQAYKALTTRWMAGTMQAAPFTVDGIMRLLQHSAQGAAQACSGGSDGTTCGFSWSGRFDNNTGIGEQMNAMDVFGALLENSTTPWSTAATASNSTATYQVPPSPSSSTSSMSSPSANPAGPSARPTQSASLGNFVRVSWSTTSFYVFMSFSFVHCSWI